MGLTGQERKKYFMYSPARLDYILSFNPIQSHLRILICHIGNDLNNPRTNTNRDENSEK
jgi:hypothetical protein